MPVDPELPGVGSDTFLLEPPVRRTQVELDILETLRRRGAQSDAKLVEATGHSPAQVREATGRLVDQACLQPWAGSRSLTMLGEKEIGPPGRLPPAAVNVLETLAAHGGTMREWEIANAANLPTLIVRDIVESVGRTVIGDHAAGWQISSVGRRWLEIHAGQVLKMP